MLDSAGLSSQTSARRSCRSTSQNKLYGLCKVKWHKLNIHTLTCYIFQVRKLIYWIKNFWCIVRPFGCVKCIEATNEIASDLSVEGNTSRFIAALRWHVSSFCLFRRVPCVWPYPRYSSRCYSSDAVKPNNWKSSQLTKS